MSNHISSSAPTIISNKRSFSLATLRELWQYRDLIRVFVYRDLVSIYKQTVLGPFWFVIQPIITTLTFTIIFEKVAKLPTEGIPSMLFYMSGIIFWSYFAECLTKISNTFVQNANLFSKVYFPRLVVPISQIISNFIKFSIQFGLFTILYLFMFPGSERASSYNALNLLLLPVVLFAFALLSFSLGLIVSSITIKYRDVAFLIQFGIQLLMYGSAVIYPITTVPVKYRIFIELNPLTGIFETVRFTLFGTPMPELWVLLYSIGFTLVSTLFAISLFSKVEKNSMDIV